MVLNMDEVDIKADNDRPPEWQTKADLLRQFEASMKSGREALKRTTDDHLLNTKWRVRDGGRLLMEQTRYAPVRTEGTRDLRFLCRRKQVKCERQTSTRRLMSPRCGCLIPGPHRRQMKHEVFFSSLPQCRWCFARPAARGGWSSIVIGSSGADGPVHVVVNYQVLSRKGAQK